MTSTTHPQMTNPWRRGFRIGLRCFKWTAIVLVALVTTAIVTGATYQAIASNRDDKTFSPPGKLIDAGGYRLHLHCQGTGSPTVVLDAGGQLWSSAWWWVQEELAQSGRVCSFDRSGLGWSELGPAPYDGIHAVEELHTLLANSGEEMPFVYVGHSLGTWLGRIYYDRYPEDLAGMVMIDPIDPGIVASELGDEAMAEEILPCGTKCRMASLAARLGLVRLILERAELAQDEKYPPYAIAEFKARASRPEQIVSLLRVGLYIPTFVRQTLEIETGDLGDLPVTAIYSGELGTLLAEAFESEEEMLDWRHRHVEAFGRLIRLSSRGSGPIGIEGANHLSVIVYEEHAMKVSALVRDMAEKIRREG